MKTFTCTSILAFQMFFNSEIFSQPVNIFSTDCEGWTAYSEGPFTAPAADWVAINGNPGGCYKGTDNANSTWYFNSSALYNTNLSAYYGYNLHFELKQNTNTFQTNEPDIIICKADGSKIVYNTAFNPGTSWTTYLVPLTEVGWKYSTLAGAAVTYSDMISFLSEVYFIKIRGDYSSIATETNWLDNVDINVGGLLPITMTGFTGNESEIGIAQLNWETLSQTNCNYFQIEKSMNNGMSFDSIGCISANGTTNISNSYQFNDNNFYGDAFYRIKSVDLDNTGNYSEIIMITNTNVKEMINVYPNPASDNLVIQNTSGASINGTIRIMDASKHVIAMNNNLNNDPKINVDVSSLVNGVYYISLINESVENTYVVQVMH